MKKIEPRNNKALIAYLKANNIRLSSKTLMLLQEGEYLDSKYYGIFTLSPRITNYFLANPILWDEIPYNFILEMAKNYDEATILNILKTNLYASDKFWHYALDKRIPKLDRKCDYLKLIENQETEQDMEIAYKAFLHPILRSDEYYLKQVKNMNKDNNRVALINEEKTLTKAWEEIMADCLPKIKEQIQDLSRSKTKIVKDFYNTLALYEDISSIKNIANTPNIDPFLKIMAIVNKVNNVDEYLKIRSIMIAIVNFIILKDNVYTSFQLECYEYDCQRIPWSIEQKQSKAFETGYLDLYTILEEMKQEFANLSKDGMVLKKVPTVK